MVLVFGLWDFGRGGRPWREGGENGSGKQYLDRQVARTKTKAGVRVWTTNTHRCYEGGTNKDKKRDEVRGIPIDEKGTKRTRDKHTGRGD